MNFGDLEGFVESMAPRKGEDDSGSSGSNEEIDIDELTSECDTKCPCCGFEWQIDARDVVILTHDEQEAASSPGWESNDNFEENDERE